MLIVGESTAREVFALSALGSTDFVEAMKRALKRFLTRHYGETVFVVRVPFESIAKIDETKTDEWHLSTARGDLVLRGAQSDGVEPPLFLLPDVGMKKKPVVPIVGDALLRRSVIESSRASNYRSAFRDLCWRIAHGQGERCRVFLHPDTHQRISEWLEYSDDGAPGRAVFLGSRRVFVEVRCGNHLDPQLEPKPSATAGAIWRTNRERRARCGDLTVPDSVIARLDLRAPCKADRARYRRFETPWDNEQ